MPIQPLGVLVPGPAYTPLGDTDVIAKGWAKSVVQHPLQFPPEELAARTKPEWCEYATRMGMLPAAIEQGWLAITKWAGWSEAVSLVKALFTEGNQFWWGSLGWSVPYPSQFSLPSSSPPMPFHTASAQQIWDHLLKNLEKYRDQPTTAAIGQAATDAGISAWELTPEDLRLLDMAVSWAQAGTRFDDPPPEPVGKSAGVHGGPFKSVGYGRQLAGPGAP